MGWSSKFTFRDCPWCGLRDTELRGIFELTQVRYADGYRYWVGLSCWRCGGFVAAEASSPNEVDKALMYVPEGDQTPSIGHLPSDVEKYYKGAVRALDAGIPDSAAVQLRRTLEAAAANKGVMEKNLASAIQKLIDTGLVTKDFGKVLDHVRKIGNLGAHYTDEDISEEGARQVLQFTTQVLRNLFEIPGEIAKLEAPK